MNRKTFIDLLLSADFKLLFNEMGWDHPASRDDIRLSLDGQEWVIREVAQKCGFHAYFCETDVLPQHVLRRKLDIQLRRYGNDYLTVFVKPDEPLHHQWMVPVKTVEKRELVTVEYASEDQSSFLFEKIEAFSFGLTEQVSIVDVTSKVHSVFTINSAKVTKDFYTGFRKHHEAFAKFIEGIPENASADRQWYASVMLNRLMFCYFIQKKGFLNLDFDYLQNKFRETRERQGRDKFYGSFYRKFLAVLFRDGLNAPRHDAAFEQTFGRIPYLNGGLFEAHRIERDHAGLDIKDQAFEDLFGFFDKWRWHLDTRMTASGRDINPDVLGYIFEQYINDRAEMGAYYTKEDITEYISKNCIIPFLFDAVSRTDSAKHFKPSGSVWRLMKDSGDAFIYPAVKKGVDLPLPPEIERGVAVETNPGEPPLRERRAAWNTPADARYALPTEIWRETVARRQRCFELRRKIVAAEITSINDLVTCNLDIRRFTEDVLEKTDDHLLIRHFYNALQNITVLDPTCGSGAFLFAALNVLEPLYEICIARMQEFHAANKDLFKDELAEIANKYRSNIQHYIYKSIILRNLYGVDIMREATEIAKLRLFLKMVAVVDVDKRAENLGLDPLPDIDFNIRCGNTLVGFANEKEILDAYHTSTDALFAFQKKDEITAQCQLVAFAFKRFKDIQLSQSDAHNAFVTAKNDLNTRLDELRKKLNELSSVFATANPFHWIAEFYEIIQKNGGFDIIVGNPPYVEYSSRTTPYLIQAYETLSAANLHAFCVERAAMLSRAKRIGFILPLGAFSTQGMGPLMCFIERTFRRVWTSSYHFRPAPLFSGANIPTAIFITANGEKSERYSTCLHKFTEETRPSLFEKVSYVLDDTPVRAMLGYCFPKFGNSIEKVILVKVAKDKALSVLKRSAPTSSAIHYRTAGGLYFKVVLDFPFPYESTSNKTAYLDDSVDPTVIIAFLNSSLQWMVYTAVFDSLNFKDYYIFSLPFFYDQLAKKNKVELHELGKKLMADYKRNAQHKRRGKTPCYEITASLAKPILDEIDRVLAEHYGFTEEELDFIINYDIKYRMGLSSETKSDSRPTLTLKTFPNDAERFAAELSIRFAMAYPGLQVSDYAEAASMAFSAKEKFGAFLGHETEKIQCVAAWRKMAKEKVFLQDANTPSVVQLTGDLRGSGWFEETPDTGTCTLSQRLAPDADVDAFVPLLHKAWQAWKKSEPSTTLVAQKQKKKPAAIVLHDNGG